MLNFFATNMDFYQELTEICSLFLYYAAYIDNSLPTFRDKISSWISGPLKVGQMGVPKRLFMKFSLFAM